MEVVKKSVSIAKIKDKVTSVLKLLLTIQKDYKQDASIKVLEIIDGAKDILEEVEQLCLEQAGQSLEGLETVNFFDHLFKAKKEHQSENFRFRIIKYSGPVIFCRPDDLDRLISNFIYRIKNFQGEGIELILRKNSIILSAKKGGLSDKDLSLVQKFFESDNSSVKAEGDVFKIASIAKKYNWKLAVENQIGEDTDLGLKISIEF